MKIEHSIKVPGEALTGSGFRHCDAGGLIRRIFRWAWHGLLRGSAPRNDSYVLGLVRGTVAFAAVFHVHSGALAQELTDIALLESKVEQACPERWEPVTAEIEIDGAADPFLGNETDRQAFRDFLAGIVDDTQTTADLLAMERDTVTVITECAAVKTALYSALRTKTEEQASDYTIGNPPDDDDGPAPTGTAAEFAADSCRQIKLGHPDSVSGVYWIQSITADTPTPFQVYCDMDSDGGGWTLVAAQFESDPVTDWNEGFQPDYDPSLAAGASFALQRYDIPPHVETAFGRDTEATFVDYVRFVYDTSDIPVVELTGKKTGELYNVHRDSGAYHLDYDPESTETSDAEWNNALTFDKTGGVNNSWAFGPNHPQAAQRGYAMNGDYSASGESEAWTVWVR